MPKQLPTQLVSGLMLRCDSSGTLLPLKSFNAGDTVELQTGPFSTLIAIVDTIDADKRIWVLMDLMGQKSTSACLCRSVAAEQIIIYLWFSNLCKLSFTSRVLVAEEDLNPRHADYDSAALTT